jgi:hypothetical protein
MHECTTSSVIGTVNGAFKHRLKAVLALTVRKKDSAAQLLLGVDEALVGGFGPLVVAVLPPIVLHKQPVHLPQHAPAFHSVTESQQGSGGRGAPHGAEQEDHEDDEVDPPVRRVHGRRPPARARTRSRVRASGQEKDPCYRSCAPKEIAAKRAHLPPRISDANESQSPRAWEGPRAADDRGGASHATDGESHAADAALGR